MQAIEKTRCNKFIVIKIEIGRCFLSTKPRESHFFRQIFNFSCVNFRIISNYNFFRIPDNEILKFFNQKIFYLKTVYI
jgi:hypothetical protein